MNELIEELIEKYSTEEEQFDGLGFPYIADVVHLEDFKQAVQIACKAQSNACLRIYKLYPWAGNLESNNIKNAEIERQDYEGINR